MKIDKLVCKEYDLTYRKISDKQVLEIQNELVGYFGDLKFLFAEGYTADEVIACVPEDTKKIKPINWDELPPENQGYGQDVRGATLSLILSKRVVNSYLKDDIKYILMNKLEKIKSQYLDSV